MHIQSSYLISFVHVHVLACAAITQSTLDQSVVVPSYKARSVLRVTTIMEYPYLTLKENGETLTGNDRFEGYCKELLDILAEELGFQYKLDLVKDSRFGEMSPKGRWNGMVGAILRDEVDFAVSSMTMTSHRAHVIDFSYPFADSRFAILMMKRSPESESELRTKSSSAFNFLKPMKASLWILTVTTLMAITGFYWFIERTVSKPAKVIGLFWTTLAFVRRQEVGPGGNSESPEVVVDPVPVRILKAKSKAGIIIQTTFVVFVIIMLSSYISKYSAVNYKNKLVKASSKSKHTSKITNFKSLDDLWRQRKVKVTVSKSGSTSSFLQKSENPTYRGVHARITAQNTFVKSTSEGIQYLREGHGEFAFGMEEFGAKYIAANYCDMKVLRNAFGPKKSFAIAFPKNSIYLKPVNDAMLRFKESGILEELETRFRKCETIDERERSHNKHRNQKKNNGIRLDLINMAGITYLLVTSFVVSIGLGLIEFYVKIHKLRILPSQVRPSSLDQLSNEVIESTL